MKKILSLVLCTALIAVFTGCSTTPVATPSLEPSQVAQTPTASPDVPSTEPSVEPSTEPSDEPGDTSPTVQKGSYGYTVTFDPALFAYTSTDGVDTFAPLTDEHKDTQPTHLSVSQLKADEIEAYKTEKLGDKKTETTVGVGAYAAVMAQTTTDSDGVTVTITNYVVALESGDALSIEITSVGDTNIAALGAMLDSLAIE